MTNGSFDNGRVVLGPAGLVGPHGAPGEKVY